jgi:glycosyltransferase involved in cell wall biosynthesis
MVLNFISNPSQGNGYSGSAELMAMALDKLVDLRLMTVIPRDVQETRVLKSKANRLNQSHSIYSKLYKHGQVGIYYGFPAGFNSLMNKYRIGFTMFETNKLPSGMTMKNGNPYAGMTGDVSDIINQSIDLLFVPCEHNKQLFRSSGVKIPIEVVHLGIDSEMYPYIDRPERKTFTYLMTGTITGRKNPFSVMKAFSELFAGRKDVELIIKTKQGTMPNIKFRGVNIKIIDKFVSSEEMLEYYKKADCFVFPSRGEGFGLPPLEAMATGLPTIIADNTGMSEYADDKYCYVIRKNKLVKANNFPKIWGDVGSFYNPDYDELVESMRYVYENKDEAKEKGRQASKWVHQSWNYDCTAKRILELIRKYFGIEMSGVLR